MLTSELQQAVKLIPGDFSGRIYLKRVRINSQGCDKIGDYWGIPSNLWNCYFDNSLQAEDYHEVDFHFRFGTESTSRSEIIAEIREFYPNAKIQP